MKTVYLDAFSGLSGDMITGALLDAGAPFAELETVIATLGLSGYRLVIRSKTASGIVATKFEVEVSTPQPERHLGEIVAMIRRGALTPAAANNAIAIFEALAAAEARVHRTTPEQVHFHEVGAVDSIIDVVAAAWGFDQLGVGTLLVGPLPLGKGFTRSRHGIIPVPPPATMELLTGFPVRLGDGESEMVTPTGAAIVKALAQPAPASLDFAIGRIAYGAGTKDFTDRPNLLRLILGDEVQRFATNELIEIAANIDDLNPQIYDHVSSRLFAAGARDVTITPTIMKKGRPGITLMVLAEAPARERIAGILFAETSTIGIRFHPVSRLKLARRLIEVETRFGVIHVKVSGDAARPANLAPEYEDCRQAALTHAAPLKLVIEEAAAAARRMLS
ncbi:MAG TPA: nickel pincer cofactor biosynthesis protein LarC [Candidatus Binataceae bacterium]|nr:nickel pincer cofactor biosynthesis protein LarC [Candidatus Binataceae bacterium]